MKDFLQRLIKYVAYIMAALVIFLAVAVGIFRLMLPRLPEYQEEIKAWASAAIGLKVDFAGMDARWRLSGPEVNFYDAELLQADGSERLLEVEELSVGVGFMRLLLDRELVVDRVLIRDTDLELRQADDGAWLIQGMRLNDLVGARSQRSQGGDAAVTVIGENIGLGYWPAGAARPIELGIDRMQIQRDARQLDAEMAVVLPEDLGERLDVSAHRRIADGEPDAAWQFFVEGRSLRLAGWSQFQPVQLPALRSGQADVSVWLEYAQDRIRSATGNLLVTGLAAGDASDGLPFDVQGRFEFSDDGSGWLLAADNFRLQTVAGEWPSSSMRVHATTGASGQLLSFDTRASFVNLDNLKLLSPWLPDQPRAWLLSFRPKGQLHGLELRLSDLDGEAFRFDLAVELERAGVSASGKWPGFEGFSGRIRADRSGGRVEIESSGLELDLQRWLPAPIDFDRALGTVIWRRNDDSTIILSDSIRIRNADLDARSSLQVSLPNDGSSPLIDFASNWTINDISAVPRYLPAKLMKPTFYAWFQDGLVAGRVRRGTTRFTGPLDRFPFDGGEGLYRVEAVVQDATLKYNPKWPAVEQIEADIVVENMRFYSTHNSANSLGNQAVDAHVEIADMREPVLTVETHATGTLESIRQFSLQSPIADAFGGQLDRVRVDGDASFSLQLRYPIRDKLNYTFTTSVQSNGGILSIEGFGPPLSDLSGVVTITRDSIRSEALTASFLGEPVSIDLVRAGEDLPKTSVIASVTGIATAAALIQDLGLPGAGRVTGAAPYNATILFPRGKVEDPDPLQIAVTSDLEGLAIAVPRPVGKTADEIRLLSLHIEFPEPNRILSSGRSGDDIEWLADFVKDRERWDLDRGVVAVGGAEATEPETRGLHIVGETPEVRLNEWLQSGAQESRGAGIGGSIRSIDLTVHDLFVVGQHFSTHHVQLDRGAQEWFIEVDGEQAVGSLAVPYDFAAGPPLVIDMQTLILPGDDLDEPDDNQTDPRTLPPISVKVGEFALGPRHFGALEAEFVRTEYGLESSHIRSKDDSFELNGAGRWVIDPADETNQRSYLTARLVSTNVAQTTQRLNYKPGLVGRDMQVDIDVSWPGGPREDLLAYLDGSIAIRLGAGQLDEVDPGAGRVFGLMSVVALPRRLSLDFRDVFAKGFSYDEITGTFRVEDGESFTCDLTLKGPAADIGIVGRASLVARDYQQTAIVSASVGDTLPVVGALAAGPQVAAALLIFSQIFKKPLQEMGQVYYSINGSWDGPAIEAANAEQFARAYELAGCLKESK